MKTLKDLFELIASETELNDKYLVKMLISIDMRYKRVDMCTAFEQDKKEHLTHIMQGEPIKTIEQIQQVYWTIFNNGRVQHQKQD